MNAYITRERGNKDKYILVIEDLTLGEIRRIGIQSGEYEESKSWATTSGDLSVAITKAFESSYLGRY
jgi:hypothetical protein